MHSLVIEPALLTLLYKDSLFKRNDKSSDENKSPEPGYDASTLSNEIYFSSSS